MTLLCTRWPPYLAIKTIWLLNKNLKNKTKLNNEGEFEQDLTNVGSEFIEADLMAAGIP